MIQRNTIFKDTFNQMFFKELWQIIWNHRWWRLVVFSSVQLILRVGLTTWKALVNAITFHALKTRQRVFLTCKYRRGERCHFPRREHSQREAHASDDFSSLLSPGSAGQQVPLSPASSSSDLRPGRICPRWPEKWQRRKTPQPATVERLCFRLEFVPGPGVPPAHRQAICWRTQRRVQGGHKGPVKDRNVSGFQSKELPCSRQRSQFQMFQGGCIWPEVSVFWEHAGSGQDKGEGKAGPFPWHSPEESRPANFQIRRAQNS